MKSFYGTALFIAIGFLAATAAAESDNCDPDGEYPYFQRRTNWMSYDDGEYGLQLVAKFYTQSVENEDGSASFQLEVKKQGVIEVLTNLTSVKIGVWPNCDQGSVPNGGAKFQINLSAEDIDQNNLAFRIPVTEMPIPNCLSQDSICMVGAFRGFVGDNETPLRISSQHTDDTQCPGSTPTGPNGVTQCPIGVKWSDASPTPSPTPTPFYNCEKDIQATGLEPSFTCENESNCSSTFSLVVRDMSINVGTLTYSTSSVNGERCFHLAISLNSVGQEYTVTDMYLGLWGADQDLNEIWDNNQEFQIAAPVDPGSPLEWDICPSLLTDMPNCTSMNDMVYISTIEASNDKGGWFLVPGESDCPELEVIPFQGCPVNVEWN
ncbi:hypothetical protein NDN08_005327 [Rhodosorus marinus]|uniref:Uncharacterized protein n=1 Tax=Rhodosorus marinus TaxID=101924 RepID=A0AAV8V4M7_9RHOD|nr:hypothetical protein NDN08_005327 [Rhodosorus marinus]